MTTNRVRFWEGVGGFYLRLACTVLLYAQGARERDFVVITPLRVARYGRSLLRVQQAGAHASCKTHKQTIRTRGRTPCYTIITCRDLCAPEACVHVHVRVCSHAFEKS